MKDEVPGNASTPQKGKEPGTGGPKARGAIIGQIGRGRVRQMVRKTQEQV